MSDSLQTQLEKALAENIRLGLALLEVVGEKDKALASAKEEIEKKSAVTEKQRAKIEEQRIQIAQLLRRLFGRSSERAAYLPGQLDLMTGEAPFPMEGGEGLPPTGAEIAKETEPEKKRPRRSRGARKPYPAELPRKDVILDVSDEEKYCACGKEKKCIGEEISEKLEVTPAQFHVIRYIKKKYACDCCKNSVVQAQMPASAVPHCGVGNTLLASLIIWKYADHLPLYRLENIFRRVNVELPRARMCDWLMTAAMYLLPLYELAKSTMLSSAVIGADETEIEMLQPGAGKTKKCYMWVYRGDEAAPFTIFDFRTSRGRAGPLAMLGDFAGTLMSDDYAAYDSVAGEPGMRFSTARCWAHARRQFADALKDGHAPAREVIAHIAALYAVEDAARDMSAGERLRLRQQKSVPILNERIKPWLVAHIAELPGSPIGKAIGYTMSNWDALVRFTTDGAVPIDNNAVERAIRPFAISRKNWLFAGGERGGQAAAIFFTLIECARRAGLNPHAYIHDVLTRMPEHPTGPRLAELLPRKPETASNPATAATPTPAPSAP